MIYSDILAVYLPTPGSDFISSSAVLGICPPKSATTWEPYQKFFQVPPQLTVASYPSSFLRAERGNEPGDEAKFTERLKRRKSLRNKAT